MSVRYWGDKRLFLYASEIESLAALKYCESSSITQHKQADSSSDLLVFEQSDGLDVIGVGKHIDWLHYLQAITLFLQ